MSAEFAQTVLYAITAVAALVWLIGLRFLLVSFRPTKVADERDFDRLNRIERQPANVIVGNAEVSGDPAELSAKAAAVLANENIFRTRQIGQIRILDQTNELVTFEGAGFQMQGARIRRGEVGFRRAATGRTAVEYRVELASPWGLMTGGVIFQLLGLIAICVGFWAISTYVVPNQKMAVRWQTVQMFQVVHFLWPPFLFGGLYRGGRNSIKAAFETLVHNLPYTAESPGVQG